MSVQTNYKLIKKEENSVFEARLIKELAENTNKYGKEMEERIEAMKKDIKKKLLVAHSAEAEVRKAKLNEDLTKMDQEHEEKKEELLKNHNNQKVALQTKYDKELELLNTLVQNRISKHRMVKTCKHFNSVAKHTSTH